MSFQSALARMDAIQTQLGLMAPATPGMTAVTVTATAFQASLTQALTGANSGIAGGTLGTAATTATAATATAATASSAYDAEILEAAQRYGVDATLVKAVVKNESGFDARATSKAGAQGLMQLMPGTAAGLGVTDAYDPAQSIDAGTRYLKAQLDRFGGDATLAVAAYNAGPNAVARYGGVPPYAETQAYVRRVLADASTVALAASAAATASPSSTDSTTGRTPW